MRFGLNCLLRYFVISEHGSVCFGEVRQGLFNFDFERLALVLPILERASTVTIVLIVVHLGVFVHKCSQVCTALPQLPHSVTKRTTSTIAYALTEALSFFLDRGLNCRLPHESRSFILLEPVRLSPVALLVLLLYLSCTPLFNCLVSVLDRQPQVEDVTDELTLIRHYLIICYCEGDVCRSVLEELLHRNRGLVVESASEDLQHEVQECLLDEWSVIEADGAGLELIECGEGTLDDTRLPYEEFINCLRVVSEEILENLDVDCGCSLCKIFGPDVGRVTDLLE